MSNKIVFRIRPRPGFESDHTPTTEDRFPIQVFAGIEGQTMQLTGELQLKMQEWLILQTALRPFLASESDLGVKVITNTIVPVSDQEEAK